MGVGPASAEILNAMSYAGAIPDDAEKLKAYLNSEDCGLLDSVVDRDFPVPELLAALAAGHGLDNTIDLCEYLNDDGNKYPSLPELVKHFPEATKKKRRNKKRVKALLNDPKKNLI